jgi:hypothetical protein
VASHPDIWTCPVNPHLMYTSGVTFMYLFIYCGRYSNRSAGLL